MKIVVLCGGLSTERKISLSSGTKVCAALRARGHKAVLVDLFLGLEDMEEEILSNPSALFDNLPELVPVVFDGVAPDLPKVIASRKWKSPSLFGRGVLDICSQADCVFMALHGMNGEDGRVQATFDLIGIPYTGSGYLGAAMSMDKMITKKMVRPAGVNTPDWVYYEKVTPDRVDEIAKATAVPCVIKTTTGGSSIGVSIVKKKEDLHKALSDCAAFTGDILVEQFIEGKEFTCAVLGDRALPSVEIVPNDAGYDYSNKYNGATTEICPGRCSREVEEKMEKTALTVHRIMGLSTYSRSDFIVDDEDNVYFLEVNSLPGMTPTSLVPQEAAAVGISYEELCEFLVNDAVERFRKANNIGM